MQQGSILARGADMNRLSTRRSMQKILETLEDTYQANGWSRDLWINDSATLRRLTNTHPDDITIEDCHRVILAATKQGSKAFYVSRIKSIMRTLRKNGDTTNTVDEQLRPIRKPRSIPKPLTREEARMLMRKAEQPIRDWFVMGCMAGLRAMEVAGLRGDDLIDHGGGKYELRVRGKGKTDLIIPVNEIVARTILKYQTLDELWPVSHPRKISAKACAEMRRLGVSPERARFHSCRHYFATSVLEVSGWDLLTTSRLMRHSNVNTTVGYTQLRNERQHEVVGLLSAS